MLVGDRQPQAARTSWSADSRDSQFCLPGMAAACIGCIPGYRGPLVDSGWTPAELWSERGRLMSAHSSSLSIQDARFSTPTPCSNHKMRTHRQLLTISVHLGLRLVQNGNVTRVSSKISFSPQSSSSSNHNLLLSLHARMHPAELYITYRSAFRRMADRIDSVKKHNHGRNCLLSSCTFSVSEVQALIGFGGEALIGFGGEGQHEKST